MPERTRRNAPPRRTRPLATIHATGTRRRRLIERRAPDPGPRATWVLIVVALVLGVGASMVILFGDLAPRTAARPTPSATPAATLVPSPSPSDRLAVGGGGDDAVGGGGTPAPDTARSLPPARSSAAPARTPAVSGELRLEFPTDGEAVVSARINAFGHAPGGARVLRDLPDGTSAESVARPDGLWFQRVDLVPGDNQLRFRLESGGEPLVVHVTLRVR